MKYDYTPSLSQLRASLKYRSGEYLRENTLHGVPYFMDSSRPKWERIGWLLLTTVSLCAAVGIIITIWHKFQTEPVLTALDMHTDGTEIDFPQILLCYDWPRLNNSNLDKFERALYERVYNWRWGESIDPPQDNTDHRKKFREIFHLLTPDCGTFYSRCAFSGIEEPCSESFAKVITPVGGCCRFNASKPLTILDSPWTFSFVPSDYPFGLYLMNKMDIGPQWGDKPLIVIHEPTEVAFNVLVTYAVSNLRYLTQRQRQCHFDGATTPDDCESRCRSRRVLEKCGCVPWFLARSGEEECTLSRYKCAGLDRKANDADCGCSLPCNHTVYTCNGVMAINEEPSSGERGACRVAMSNWPNGFFRKDTRFGYLDLLVSFGGIAGLFLGYSILTTVELVYYFTLKVYCGAVVDTSRKKCNIARVHVTKSRRPRVPANSVYYDYVD